MMRGRLRQGLTKGSQDTQGISRRSLLVGGGATAGLLLAWGAWPRHYEPNLPIGSGEHLFNAWLKIDTAGQIVVAVPQLEMGQGVTTVLPQILADELGADWRTVAVQSAPINPLYANSMLVEQWLDPDWVRLGGSAGQWALREYARRNAIMVTGGGTAIPMFAQAYRDAGSAARVLLCKAAAARWDVPWESCDVVEGLVTDGRRKLRIGELAADAVGFSLPEFLPERQGREGRLYGQDLPRLDLPSKLDGSHNFAADIRLPDMVFASIRQGPAGGGVLSGINEDAARKVAGFLQTVRTEEWVAAIATNSWAANRALDALDPVFVTSGAPVSTAAIDHALTTAFASEDGRRIYEQGNLASVFDGASVLKAEYQVGPALHLAIETPCATARVADGKVELWVATQAPVFCRRAVAKALGLAETQVTLYPVAAGGSFDRRLDHDAAVQAAVIASKTGRPVQLLWSRLEETIHDRPRPPARARMAAKLGRGGVIEGWSAKVAAPSTMVETWSRIATGADSKSARTDASRQASRLAVSGMATPYGIPHRAVDHYPADIGLPTGASRGQADSYGVFFAEAFVDELAHHASVEPMSFRIQMLTGQPRLAHCLTTAAAMGGWQGGTAGSGQGIACHAMDGCFIAVLVEAGIEAGRLAVRRIVAAADCGDQPHPDIARQQIEGGLMFGLAAAMGGEARYRAGLPVRAIMGRQGLPLLSDIGEVTVELVESTAEPGGVEQIGVPAIAPAIASALFTVTGRRYRSLPLLPVK